ncbi:hypothetical protein C5167_007755 [Papaver somniferum]|uniref:uncharacterized protein LOC113325832 n=1 Tax=Papaver somniferum TaxID=3469 RepID=UPI000E6F8DA5|nr:uncharacterized protein LOC113325832 [Papaver somniferum]RZC85141.1 hypothetical protein C5167_007755 [Papaver somniferum]
MAFSLGSSGLIGSKLALRSNSFKRQKSFKMISCRVASKAGSGGKNLYKVLSLSNENVSGIDIKRAYRTMALQYHPDVCPPSRKDESSRVFVELHKAYKILSDPISRRKYDLELGLNKYDQRMRYNTDEGGYDGSGIS